MPYFFKPSEVVGLDKKLVDMLNNARGIANIPFIINSGLRSPEKNKEIGGVEDSSHLKGLAADIRCLNDKDRYSIVFGALAAGFKRIGIGKGHIHLDIDLDKQWPIVFVE